MTKRKPKAPKRTMFELERELKAERARNDKTEAVYLRACEDVNRNADRIKALETALRDIRRCRKQPCVQCVEMIDKLLSERGR